MSTALLSAPSFADDDGDDVVACATYLPCHPETGELTIPVPENPEDLECYRLYHSQCAQYRSELRWEAQNDLRICEELHRRKKTLMTS